MFRFARPAHWASVCHQCIRQRKYYDVNNGEISEKNVSLHAFRRWQVQCCNIGPRRILVVGIFRSHRQCWSRVMVALQSKCQERWAIHHRRQWHVDAANIGSARNQQNITQTLQENQAAKYKWNQKQVGWNERKSRVANCTNTKQICKCYMANPNTWQLTGWPAVRRWLAPPPPLPPPHRCCDTVSYSRCCSQLSHHIFLVLSPSRLMVVGISSQRAFVFFFAHIYFHCIQTVCTKCLTKYSK